MSEELATRLGGSGCGKERKEHESGKMTASAAGGFPFGSGAYGTARPVVTNDPAVPDCFQQLRE